MPEGTIMGNRLRIFGRRLFFYSSRQLFRRKRTYLSVFLTSIALMTVAMAALEVLEVEWLRGEEILAFGNYHAKIEGALYDYSEEIAEDSTVREAWAIPWSSWLASSVDASLPARVSVENETTDRALNVTYIWGHPPGDGEIAVSDSLYASVNWLEVGSVNDLWFSATKMTYFPLTVSGIYTDNDLNAEYVFVTENTARQIDRETGAVMKYDNFFNCDYNSDRYVAKTFDRLWHRLRLSESDFQTLKTDGPKEGPSAQAIKYSNYINGSTLNSQVKYAATPVVIEVLPIVAAAALILAVFMTNWSKANAPELGILGAIGANRIQLCAISAGQILLITALSAPVVVPLSALFSLVYVTAFNRAVVGIGYVFSIPWRNLFKSTLWFVALSTVFTYLGIAAMTREPSFVLISGSYRGKSPLVRKSSRALERVKDKVARLALLETLRQIGPEVVHAVIGSLISLVLGYFLLNQIFAHISAVDNIQLIQNRLQADTVIAAKTDPYGRYTGKATIPASLADDLAGIDGIASCGRVSELDSWGWEFPDKNTTIETFPHSNLSGDWDSAGVYVTDRDGLPFLMGAVREGDPDELFSDPYAVVIAAGPSNPYLETLRIGQEFQLIPSLTIRSGTPILPEDPVTFHIAAVVSRAEGSRISGAILVNPEGAEAEGLLPRDVCQKLYLSYDPDLTQEEGEALTEKLMSLPALLRYDVSNERYLSESEKGIELAHGIMTGLFLGTVLLAFCVLTYMNASMKTARSRREFAVERQMGASDRDIYKKMRVMTYPSAVISVGLTVAVVLGFCAFHILTAMAELNIQADMFPLTYTPEFYAKCREEIFGLVAYILPILAAALPMQIVTALTAVLGTVIPTRRLLREPVTEGLRKDTD